MRGIELVVPKRGPSWPQPLTISPEQAGVNSAIISILHLQASIEMANNSIKQITTKPEHLPFFVAHFGMDPAHQIYSQYFKGKIVNEGAGPGNSLSIAQEIFEFTTPSPVAYGITLNNLSLLTSSMARIDSLEARKEAARTELLPQLEASIFTLTVRPAGLAVKIFNQNLIEAYNKGVRATHRLVADPNKTFYGFTNDSQQKQHPAGFIIDGYEILNYYQKAYAGSAAEFVSFSNRHRIMANKHPMYPGKIFVGIWEVDPATGAVTGGNQYPVASSTNPDHLNNSGYFLSEVRKYLFPEMHLMSEGIVLNSEERKESYKSQLDKALAMWSGIPNKVATPIAVVMSQSFHWNPQSGAEMKPSDKTTPPVTKLKVMLQPAGIEEAMKKVLDVSHPNGNAIERWFTTKHIPNVMITGDDYKYVIANMSLQDFTRTYLNPYYQIMGELYRVISDPYIYEYGVFNYLNQYSRDWSKVAVSEILKLANWPEASPQLLFQAPIDDEADATILLNMLKNHLAESREGVTPNMMKVAQTFNGKVASRVQITSANAQSTEQGGLPSTAFKFAKGIDPMTNMSRTKVYPSVYPSGRTILRVLYTKSSKAILSNEPVEVTKIDNLPIQIQMQPPSNELISDSAVEFNTAMKVAGGVTILAIIAAVGASIGS